ncbi:hypothetical protein L5515_012084 [Caenorhabditis briggsae]|uniref:Uncharacterized protein n=1 Tax=Caenorhabditis briggsae TaxID=6238 RepID=A0AAE9ERN2_CAEBR|nr:hypothetical protein L5515_012084 [Caenorhabditis briggsae]
MGDLLYLMSDEDVALTAALAFTLEFFESEKPALNTSLEKKPIPYFSYDDRDTYHEDYRPQCEQIDIDYYPTIFNYEKECGVLEESEVATNSEYSNPRKSPPQRRGRPALASKEPPLKKSKTREPPKPTRASSRVQILQLARQEAEKNKPHRQPLPRNAKKTNKPKPKKTKKPTVETYYMRKKREKENLVNARIAKQQRKTIAEATKSLVRAFGQVASVQTKTGRQHLSAWQKWLCTSTKFVKDLSTNPRRAHNTSEFHIFLVNSVTVMQNTMCSFRPRPPETHNLMMRFVADFTKIWNIAFTFGTTTNAGDVTKLLEYVIGHFIAYPKRMNATNLSWIQTKLILDQLLSLITRVEIIYDTMFLLSKIQHNLLRKWAHQSHEALDFKSYALSQLHSFSMILNSRLLHLSNQHRYFL